MNIRDIPPVHPPRFLPINPVNFLPSLTTSIFALALIGLLPSGVCQETATNREAEEPLDFDSLDSEMKKIVRDLEATATEWNRNRPIMVHPSKASDDWQKAALTKIANLDPARLERLAQWLINDRDAPPVARFYQSAIFKEWASLDFKKAHAYLIDLNKWGQSGEKSESAYMQTATFDEVQEVFSDVHTGHAMADPKSAWRDFNSDRSDPTIGKLGAEVITASVFEPYAARFPDEAWKLVLTVPKDHDPVYMAEGFVTGAPHGQNWQAKADEFAKSLVDRGIPAANWKYRIIVHRWLLEAPEAALEWYASHASPAEVRSVDPNDPFSGLVLPGEALPQDIPQDEAKSLLQLELLDFANHSHGEDMTPVLDRLSAKGYGKLVTSYLKKEIDLTLDCSDGPVLAYIPRLSSRELQQELFLLALKAIPPHGDNPYEPTRSAQAKAILEAVRELAGRLDLPADIRKLADETFRRVQAEQLKVSEEREKR